jgi:hypothetical protein
MWLHKISVCTEILAFFFVTPEFLGAQRLESMEKHMRRRAVAEEMEDLERQKEKLRKALGLKDRGTRRSVFWVLPICGIVVVGFVSWLVHSLRKATISLNEIVLIWVVISASGLVILALVALIILYMRNLLLLSLNVLRRRVLQSLAGNDRLRLWVFWFGTVLFLVSKVLAWHEP